MIKYPLLCPFSQNLAKLNFPKKSGSVTFQLLWSISSCKKSEKANEPILRKNSSLKDERTNTAKTIGPIP